MQENKTILQEISGIAPSLAHLRNLNPYAVPDGYFDSLSDEVLTAITLFTLSAGKSAYTVPDGYFDGLADTILTTIKAHESEESEVNRELNHFAPLLTTISKANVYSLPDDYFVTFSSNLSELQEEKAAPAEVVSITSNIRKLLHYAVAASVMLVITGTSYLYLKHNIKNNNAPSIEQRLATLNEDDILSYLKYDHQADDILPASNLQDNTIQTLLMDTPDEEIQNYLIDDNETDEKNVNGI